MLKKTDFYHTVRTKTIELDSTVEDWSQWVKKYEISYAQLKDFNPWIRDIRLDNPDSKVYQVKIPYIEDLFFDPRKVHIHNKKWLDQ